MCGIVHFDKTEGGNEATFKILIKFLNKVLEV